MADRDMPLARPDAVVFDMDGTLFDSSWIVPAAYADVIAANGGPQLEPEDVYALYPLGPPERIVQHVLGVDGDALSRIVGEYHQALGELVHRIRPYPGVVDALDALGAAGVATAVFTGADQASCELLVHAVGLGDRFASLLGTDVAGAPKPAPDGLLLTCERLDVAPARTAYVGDGPLDQRCAHAAGAIAVSAAWGHLYDPDEPAHLQAATPAELVAALAVGATS